MTETFKDKVALVTGGSFGIGRATAIAFAARGATVIIADNVQDSETCNIIQAAAGNASLIQCDVSRAGDVQAMIKSIITTYGQLDYAFNNAGIEGVSAPTHDCSEENWDRVIDINLKGVWLCMKYELAEMLKQGKGSIVNCASIAGLVGFPGSPAYVASKHGIVGLTKTAALETAKKGIRVNAICPGVIKTAMIDRVTGSQEEAEKTFAGAEPIGRMGLPDEVANAVIWLCSDESSFVTGLAMPVDGGWVAQ